MTLPGLPSLWSMTINKLSCDEPRQASTNKLGKMASVHGLSVGRQSYATQGQLSDLPVTEELSGQSLPSPAWETGVTAERQGVMTCGISVCVKVVCPSREALSRDSWEPGSELSVEVFSEFTKVELS